MENAKIRQLINDLCDVLNSYEDIPVEVKRLIVGNLLTALDREADKAIDMEIQSLKKEKTDEQSL